MELSQARTSEGGSIVRVFEKCRASLARAWSAQRKKRSLVVRETAALGERRFVAVVQCGRQRFLIGTSPGSVTLLSRLDDEDLPGDEK